MPDVASLPEKTTFTGWFHQPPRSGTRSGDMEVMVGAVASYLTAAFPVAAFPAMSRHPPLISRLAASGPEYVGASQLAMPDVGSVPWKVHFTAWFHQPARSAARSGVAALRAGAVASYLIAAPPVALLPAVSRQAPLTVPAAMSGPE